MNKDKKKIFFSLNKKEFLKIDLTLFKEIKKELEFISYIVTLCGCSAIDIDYEIKDIEIIKKNINLAIKDARKLCINLEHNPFLIISFFRKELNCESKNLKEMVISAINLGADIIEFHLNGLNFDQAIEVLQKIKDLELNFVLSLSISRKKLSNASIIEIIKYAREIVGKNLIIEVDGLYEKNYTNEYSETLQALSTADIINKQLINKEQKFRRLPLLISGGTNQLTKELADNYGVNYNGITYNNYLKKYFSKIEIADLNKKNDSLKIIENLKEMFSKK